MKIKPKLTGSEGATVISFFKKAGIPAFATGFAADGTALSSSLINAFTI